MTLAQSAALPLRLLDKNKSFNTLLPLALQPYVLQSPPHGQ